MIYEVIDINIDYSKLDCEKGDYQPKLHIYIPNDADELQRYMPKRPTMLICPGGAYRYTSDRECEPIALYYLSKGYNCFILRYSCEPARFPVQLAEAGKALMTIKENAEKWHVDTDNINVIGFSAGGHLAASLGVFWDKKFLADILNTTNDMLKFKSLVLSYPVISYPFDIDRKILGCRGSFKNLLGVGEKFEDKDALDFVCLDKHVSENTPPCFIWHTYEDASVPVETTLTFALALRKHDVPMELHIYEHGKHGQSTGTVVCCDKNQRLSDWMDISFSWLEEQHGIQE